MNQLYGEKNREAITIAARSLWADHILARFTISVLPQYHEDSYKEFEAQIDHRNWVMDQIKARYGSPLSIGRACYIHKVLPEDDARLVYGQERLDQAKAEIVFDGLVPDELSAAEASLPSCFGLPGAHDAGGGNCEECPVFRSCLKVGTLVCNAIVKKFGSDDPVLRHRRSQGRKRTARSRAKSARRSEALDKAAAKPG